MQPAAANRDVSNALIDTNNASNLVSPSFCLYISPRKPSAIARTPVIGATIPAAAFDELVAGSEDALAVTELTADDAAWRTAVELATRAAALLDVGASCLAALHQESCWPSAIDLPWSEGQLL
jgi:CRP-like cAMP-binding protein